MMEKPKTRVALKVSLTCCKNAWSFCTTMQYSPESGKELKSPQRTRGNLWHSAVPAEVCPPGLKLWLASSHIRFSSWQSMIVCMSLTSLCVERKRRWCCADMIKTRSNDRLQLLGEFGRRIRNVQHTVTNYVSNALLVARHKVKLIVRVTAHMRHATPGVDFRLGWIRQARSGGKKNTEEVLWIGVALSHKNKQLVGRRCRAASATVKYMSGHNHRFNSHWVQQLHKDAQPRFSHQVKGTVWQSKWIGLAVAFATAIDTWIECFLLNAIPVCVPAVSCGQFDAASAQLQRQGVASENAWRTCSLVGQARLMEPCQRIRCG